MRDRLARTAGWRARAAGGPARTERGRARAAGRPARMTYWWAWAGWLARTAGSGMRLRAAGQPRRGGVAPGPLVVRREADQPGAAQARGHPDVRCGPGRGRGRVPGGQHVPDRAALQRPHPWQPVLGRGLPRPATARRHAGLRPPRCAHHARASRPRPARSPRSSPVAASPVAARPVAAKSGVNQPGGSQQGGTESAAGRGGPQPSVGSQVFSVTYQQVEQWPGGFADQITIRGLSGLQGPGLEPGLRLSRGARRQCPGRALGAGPGRSRGGAGHVVARLGADAAGRGPGPAHGHRGGRPAAPSGCAFDGQLCTFGSGASS